MQAGLTVQMHFLGSIQIGTDADCNIFPFINTAMTKRVQYF
jgi:hypothetical protein